VLDCQLFDYENQVGTEYLFGTVRCPALTEKLGQGEPIISDEREGLNRNNPFVAAFARSVSGLLAEHVLAEREKLKHLDHASTSDRTAHMVERLLHRAHGDNSAAPGGVLPAPLAKLPPLLTMERLLFLLIGLGFALLTLTLITGMTLSESLFGHALRFTHETLFAVIAWIVFGVLLAGRLVYGWRGRVAMRWARVVGPSACDRFRTRLNA